MELITVKVVGSVTKTRIWLVPWPSKMYSSGSHICDRVCPGKSLLTLILVVSPTQIYWFDETLVPAESKLTATLSIRLHSPFMAFM